MSDKTYLHLGSHNYLLPLDSQIVAGETVEAWKVLDVAGGGVEAGSVPGATHAAIAQTATETVTSEYSVKADWAAKLRCKMFPIGR